MNNNIYETINQLKALNLFPTLDQFKSLSKELLKQEPEKYKTYNNALDGISKKFGKRKYQAIKKELKDVCRWSKKQKSNDDSCNYKTTCNQIHTFSSNILDMSEKNMKFCSYCGKKIEEKYLPSLNEIKENEKNIEIVISRAKTKSYKENIIGKHGIGKTTLLYELMKFFKNKSIEYLFYDFKKYGFDNNFNLNQFFKQVKKEVENKKPLWIFIDEAQLLQRDKKEAYNFIQYLELNTISLTLVSAEEIFKERKDFLIMNLNEM